jgi:hypothetical protein
MINTRFWRCLLLIVSVSVCSIAAQQPTRVTLFIGPQVRDRFLDVDQGVLGLIPSASLQASALSAII